MNILDLKGAQALDIRLQVFTRIRPVYRLVTQGLCQKNQNFDGLGLLFSDVADIATTA